MSINRIASADGSRLEDEALENGLRRLGGALRARTADVVATMTKRSLASARTLDRVIEESFEQVGTTSTVAVARWMAGEGEAVAREVGEASWRVFAQLASHREASLNEVTKRCLRWRDSAAEVLSDSAGELGLDPDVLERALQMLQRSVDVTLVRMCELFEEERQRSHEELARRQRELIFLATHDALTGLPNRTLILDRIEQALSRARPTQEPVAALFLDLDNFKAINDSLGHRVGDELLCAVAARLEGLTRETDALGRLGGDEFVLIADGLSLAAGPELIAERLLEAFEEPFVLSGVDSRQVFVKASIGIATDRRASAEELLRDADIAMYRAKWGGKSRYLVFESGMQEEVQSRMEIEMDLQEALEKEEFFLVYQPTFDLENMVPTGVEALIRWRRPGRGIAQPEEFIPLLEENGLIVDVGAWVLREACAQAARWRGAGHPLSLAVNVSVRQLETDDLLDHVDAALRSGGLDADMLTIEITETALMSDVEETARRLVSLKDAGVRIAVDDFGTGYSSLAYLKRLPLTTLKIDKEFIGDLTRDADDEAITGAVIAMAHSLGLIVVAEGVETEAQVRFLHGHGCDEIQGYWLAHPLHGDECLTFLRSWAVAADETGRRVVSG
jgi:diguanylate cyclase (GGDEF)-like protein